MDALGDPSRRAIVALLSSEGPSSVGLLAARLPISRPAVSQHLRVLKQARLVAYRPEGTRRIYALDDSGLADLRAFIDAFWRSGLDRFASFVDQEVRGGGTR